MVFEVFWNIILGVVGSIISSVIVSRVFLLQGDNQKQLEILEANVNKISYIHGELSVLRKVVEIIHDQDVNLRQRIAPYEEATDEDILDSQKTMDKVQCEILEMMKKDVDKTNVELGNLFLVNAEAMEVIRCCLEYVRKIQAMKNCSFASFDKLDVLYKNAKQQYETYAVSNRKRLIKQVISDPVMIVLYVIVLLIIVGAIISKIYGI